MWKRRTPLTFIYLNSHLHLRSRLKMQTADCFNVAVEPKSTCTVLCLLLLFRNITSSKTKPSPEWHRQCSASEIATCAAAAPGCWIIGVIMAAALSSSRPIKFLSHSASLCCDASDTTRWESTENCPSLSQDRRLEADFCTFSQSFVVLCSHLGCC